MRAVYFLTLRQLSGRWRLVIMTILAALPVLIAVMMTSEAHSDSVAEFESVVLSGMLAGSIVPLVVLAIAAPSFANEVEDRTIANLTLTPIPRWQIVLPKLLGAISIAGPFVLGSAALTSWIAYLGDGRAMAAVIISSLAGVALYAAAFVFLGLLTTQAIAIGLLYIVLWEGLFAGFVQGVRLLSIRHYAIALMHGIDPRRFPEGGQLSFTVAIIVSLVVLGGFVFLSIRRIRRMDIP